MDNLDRDLEKAERDASPERFPEPPTNYEKILEEHNSLHRVASQASSSTSTSSSLSVARQPTQTQMSRINTQRDLERHPTSLSRIQTERSQHLGTVGRTATSRASKKALPNFGENKPYPPPLPEQEEYVVEFDGPRDPMHPQNWPMKKKYDREPKCRGHYTNEIIDSSSEQHLALPLLWQPSLVRSSPQLLQR